MKKQLVLLMLLFLPMVSRAEPIEIDGIYYNLISKLKTAEVTYHPQKYSGNIVIPEKVIYNDETYDVISIGINAFYECSISSVKIPGSVKSIEAQAFQSCRNLSTIVIPEGVESIGVCAFRFCRGAKSVKLPSTLIKIESQAFDYCDKLDSICITDIVSWCNIHFDTNPLYYNRRLFLNGDEVINLTIPSSVSKINQYAFRGCSSITSVTMQEGVASIDYCAFDGCPNLESVSLPESMISIGICAFFDCKKLKTIIIPQNVSTIANSAFGYCESLETIVIPNSISVIENEVFMGCSKLTTVTLPSSINTINYNAFTNCSELKDIYCYALKVPSSSEDIFSESYIEYATLHVRESSIDAYSSTHPWKKFKEIVKIDMPKYTLKYIVDGEEYKSYQKEEGEEIAIEANPVEEGYSFSGWSEIPEIMPAHDVTITGTFSINSYKLTYMIDDKVYKETMCEYGATITPEPQPEGDYQSFEWTDLPQTMPAHDVVVHASYTSGIIEVLIASQHNVHIYSPNGKKLNKQQKGLNIIIFDDGLVKKAMMK